MSEHIQYDFLYDNHFSELKETELFTERLNAAAQAEPYVGRYFSQDFVRRKLLRQTEEEMMEQDELMEKEIKDGTIPDPNMAIDPMTGQPLEAGAASMDLGAPVMEPDLESNSKTTELPKGGEI